MRRLGSGLVSRSAGQINEPPRTRSFTKVLVSRASFVPFVVKSGKLIHHRRLLARGVRWCRASGLSIDDVRSA